jgi:hypothetical protein
MERKNIYSIMIMIIVILGTVLTYHSWELFRGWLIIWAGILTLEVMLLGVLIAEFIKDNLK